MTPRTGTPTSGVGFCQQCGAPLEKGVLFCAACGAKVETNVAPTVAPAKSPKAPKPAKGVNPDARGRWARGARIAIAALLALVIVAGIGFWPQWSGLLPLPHPASDRATASAWLQEGPTDPVVFTRRPVWATPDVLLKDPGAYQQRIVLLSGVPVSVSAEGTLSIAAFESGGKRVVVGYPGGTRAFAAGKAVSVAGVLAPTGDELLAVAVSQGVPGDTGRTRDLATLTLAAAAAFALSALFVRLRRGRNRRNRRALSAAAVVVSLIGTMFLGGCEIVIRTEVARDGSGTVSTHVITGEDSMTELMDLPNAEAFIDSWTATQERAGLKVERTTNQLKVDRTFAKLEDFGAESGATQGSWSRLGSVDMPDGRHVFFLAAFDTASVYPDAPAEGTDTQAYDKLKEEIDGSTLRYELKLPGSVLGSNGDSEGTWDVPMGGKRFLFAESLTGSSESDSRLVAAQHIWESVVRWLFAVAAGLLVFGILAYPWRTKGGESRG